MSQKAHLTASQQHVTHTSSYSREQRRVAVWQYGQVALIYTLIAVFFTYPTMIHLSDAIGGSIDNREYYWNLWWVYRSVVQLGQNPLITGYIYYPFGTSLYFHTLDPLNGFLSLPLQICCGIAVAFNLMNLFWFIMAGLGAYTLAMYLTHNRAAAFVAGLVYGFSPYMAFHLDVGQIASLSTGTMAFYLLFVLKGVREHPWYLLAAAAVLWLIGMSDWHYLAFSVTITGLVGIYEAIRLRRTRAIAVLFAKLASVGGIFFVLFAPILIPMVREYAQQPYAQQPFEDSVYHSADLLAFFLPSIFHPLWGDWAGGIFDRLTEDGIVGGIATLGYVALTLAVVAIVREWRRSALFVLLLAAGFLLALGPYLQIGGVNSFYTDRPIPMPFLAFRKLPFMEINRFPSRFVSVAMLGLAMLAAIGFASIWDWMSATARAARWQRVWLAAIALLVLFEFWPRPFPIEPARAEAVPPFYRTLGADPGDYAILEVPNLKQGSMWYQTYHHKRILGGRISREKVHPWQDARFFGPLLQGVAPWKDIGVNDDAQSWRAALACQNIRYVVFYKHPVADEVPKPAAVEALQQKIFSGITPSYEDDTLRAYGPIADAPREPYWTPDERWYEPETTPQGVIFRWLKGDTGSLLVYPCGEVAVTLHMQLFGYAQARTVQISLNGQPVAHVPVESDQFKAVDLPLTLRPGENLVELHSDQPAVTPASLGGSRDERTLTINISEVSLLPR